MIFITVVVVTVIVAVLFICRSRKERNTPAIFAIGGELAEARRAETEHLHSHPDAPSPMKNIKYDFWKGDLDLISPNVTAVDQDISGFLATFAAGSDSTQGDIRSRIKMEEFYQLLTFGRRMAVFSLRSGDMEQLKTGLIAIGVIDSKRVDYRDVLIGLALLYHSAQRNGLNAERLFKDAASLATPDTARLIDGFLSGPPEKRDVRRSWGYEEVGTGAAIGFIGWGLQPYQPTYDLKNIAIDVAKLVAADRYYPGTLQVATNLPAAWFGVQTAAQQECLDAALRSITGAATVHGKLRAEHHLRSDVQSLIVFIVECLDVDHCAVLQSLSNLGSPRCSSLGASNGRLFFLVVARSFMAGIESYETPQMLDRFREPLTALLNRAHGTT
jgi:hypothetical protein